MRTGSAWFIIPTVPPQRRMGVSLIPPVMAQQQPAIASRHIRTAVISVITGIGLRYRLARAVRSGAVTMEAGRMNIFLAVRIVRRMITVGITTGTRSVFPDRIRRPRALTKVILWKRVRLPGS